MVAYKQSREDMNFFCPFYDKLADRFRVSFIGKLVLSMLLGF